MTLSLTPTNSAVTINHQKIRSVIDMLYGYCRCSTNEKLQDIDRQKNELVKLGVEDRNIYLEYESGSKADRIQFNRLLGAVKQGDTIATLEVSRLTRSTRQLCDIIQLVSEMGLKLVIKDSITIDCTANSIDPMTKAFLQIAGVFAELERDIISQRVKSGLENARTKGSVIGRPTITINNLPPLFLKHYPKYLSKQITQEELARLCEVSRQSVIKYISVYKQGTLANQ